jgi:hypothetical protein
VGYAHSRDFRIHPTPQGKNHLAKSQSSKMNPSDYTLFYSNATLTTFTADQMLGLFGINIQTISIEVLNYQSFYPVVETNPTADTGLYIFTPVYTVNGEIADQTWTYTARPVPTAKNYASAEVKNSSNTQASNLIGSSGINVDIWTGAASQAVIDRPPLYAALLDEMTVIGDSLATTLTAIDAATTVDEINNIVNPPTGILSTGRGAGDGPLDLNISFYTEFNSVSLTEAETELYIPATSTVLTYGEFAPDVFDSAGNCFTTGNYLVQIREVATSRVFAEFECPLSPTNVDVAF